MDFKDLPPEHWIRIRTAERVLIFRAVVGVNSGQSEPAGTCEKQRYCSFSLSIRCVARLARACSGVIPTTAK